MTSDDPALVNTGPVEGGSPVLTVWSDIGCPWAALALHSVRAASATLDLPVLVDHRAFPLELFNREPTPKYIVDVELAAIAGRVPETGWRRWSAPEWTYPSTMLPALEAVQAAKSAAVGGLRASDELDTALRHAFYTTSRPIAVHAVILELAEECEHVDAGALAEALRAGAGRAEVYSQWDIARGPGVQGSPHLFAPGGYAAHNPGVSCRWTERPEKGGFPMFEAYDDSWARELVRRLHGQG
ncbi:DsbA family protein [Streptomyces sp. NPDC007346]|uniref:DsbA family oxidoreductase n=1 Tax=Streptomyces sp. NPDC007346 TaxID=3154682 RepID=UPI0034564292